ncbi:MAG: RES family NAD+ phosphorylase [Sulfurimonas sp.]|uniref:RES family NAD+ phosphorylase n=1 Tax=Sulfurimonas sp. TaxID=2022749 RepID=UPI0025EFC189|nr:RES family NAD+ phosphorylase [Sulfurimonas sp.]MCK9490715.1 RES family NAD+ phosphorylase [Sulfurimonas sp.]
MKYCENCFDDGNLQEYIEQKGTKSNSFTCNNCGTINSEYLLEDYALSSWIKGIIYKVYSYEDGMAYTVSKTYIEDDENITDYAPFRDLYSVCGDLFSCEQDDIIRIINNETSQYAIMKDGGEDYFLDPYSQCWVKECWFDHSPRHLNWNNFSENVKHSLRFFNNKDFNREDELEKLSILFDYLGIYKLSEHQCYRVRGVTLDKISTVQDDPEKELGSAPHDKSKHNRFSPSGISYVYLAFDQETAYKEVLDDAESLNYFSSCWKLDTDLNLLDLRKDRFEEISSVYTNPFSNKYDSYVECGEEFLMKFIHKIQKSISEYDKVLEYIPTQVLAEYIRLKGYDGFVFNSSKNKDGINIVLFDKSNLKFVEYEKV